MSSQPNVMINTLVDSIKESLNDASMLGFESFAEQTIEFFRAIDWTQPWIMTLIIFHTICLFITFGLRNQHDRLSVYFFVLLGFAALTQPLNSFAMKNWKAFSTESYFDESGVFVVCVYALPLISNGCLALIFILKAIVSLLIQTKRAQLQNKMRQSSKSKSKKQN
ncbi:transmembrane protein 18-domain-containing protein [Thamnidium elegans]|nr:transmembrane protein 18-domain-containing protein [Thamnidium elegans]